MKPPQRENRLRPVLANLLSLALLSFCCSGCGKHLAFGTETKFGLDISQRPDQQVDITMGYRRAEMVSIPIFNQDEAVSGQGREGQTEDLAATDQQDAYSVLGRFSVEYDHPLKDGPSGLHLHQVFATGMAARKAATNAAMQAAFGKAAREVQSKGHQR